MAIDPATAWLVWVPGEDAPHIHQSRKSASDHAHAAARDNVGARVKMFQLKEVGSVTYPDNPLILGDALPR